MARRINERFVTEIVRIVVLLAVILLLVIGPQLTGVGPTPYDRLLEVLAIIACVGGGVIIWSRWAENRGQQLRYRLASRMGIPLLASGIGLIAEVTVSSLVSIPHTYTIIMGLIAPAIGGVAYLIVVLLQRSSNEYHRD